MLLFRHRTACIMQAWHTADFVSKINRLLNFTSSPRIYDIAVAFLSCGSTSRLIELICKISAKLWVRLDNVDSIRKEIVVFEQIIAEITETSLAKQIQVQSENGRFYTLNTLFT